MATLEEAFPRPTARTHHLHPITLRNCIPEAWPTICREREGK